MKLNLSSSFIMSVHLQNLHFFIDRRKIIKFNIENHIYIYICMYVCMYVYQFLEQNNFKIFIILLKIYI